MVKGKLSLRRDWTRLILPQREWTHHLRYHIRIFRQAHQEQYRFRMECQEDTVKGLSQQHHQGQVEESNISRRSCTLLRQFPELLKETTWMILRPESVQWNQVLCRNHLQVGLVLLVLG